MCHEPITARKRQQRVEDEHRDAQAVGAERVVDAEVEAADVQVDPVEMLVPLRMRHVAEAAAEQPEVEPETQQENSHRNDGGDPPRRAFWRQQHDNTREQGQEDNSGRA